MSASTRSALCLFVRDEVADITEWLAHHAAIGFEHFLIYDNASSDGTSELLGALSEVLPITRVEWPGDATETIVEAYQHCLQRFGGDYDWIAFFDVDEFLIPPPGGMLQDLLAQHAEQQSFVMNRLTFGSSGLRRLGDRLIMSAFTLRGPFDAPVNAAVRSFVRPAYVRVVANPHLIATAAPAVTMTGRAAIWSSEGPGMLVPWNVTRADFALHHYATRSDEHWLRGVGRPGRRGSFAAGDLNTETDTSALPYAARVAKLMHGRLAPIIGRHVVARQAPPIVVDHTSLLCNIDEVSPRRVRGWMWSGADPLVPPRLHALIDDTEILAFAPDLPREDVTAAGIGGLRVGFCFRIPFVWFDGQPHRLRLRLDDGTDIAISQHGKVVASCHFDELHTPEPLEGAFDGIKGVYAEGWVLREGDPTALLMGGVEILITCGERKVGQFIANQPRPDVGAIHGNEVTAPLCGFSAYIPKVFRIRQEQIFRVMTVPDGIELRGSPVVAAFL